MRLFQKHQTARLRGMDCFVVQLTTSLGQWPAGQGLGVLTSFLNTCSLQGQLAACFSSALATPRYKKVTACAGDGVNYRPIAVGELLHRLYAIILNDRLLAWSEEHGLCSPAIAGFCSCQSPMHHLFDLHHFTKRAMLIFRRGL